MRHCTGHACDELHLCELGAAIPRAELVPMAKLKRIVASKMLKFVSSVGVSDVLQLAIALRRVGELACELAGGTGAKTRRKRSAHA